MNYRDFTLNMRRNLEPLYGAGEAAAMTRLIIHNLKGWNQTELIINGDLEVSERVESRVQEIMQRLANHEPLQYILGEARFYGMDLKVTPATLIPRPETAELVDLILDTEKNQHDLRVLDIGTGSGAIAIALSRNLPFSNVSAIDISAEALNVARENASHLHAKINFSEQDVFTFTPLRNSLDIIVSNPPYIAEEEREAMDRNVKDYEPASALFVPDTDPLIYYSRITELGRRALSPGGRIYFEINPRFAEPLLAMMRSNGFDTQIFRDSSSKKRFAFGVKIYKRK